jgi:diaminopimelate decarboxylase
MSEAQMHVLAEASRERKRPECAFPTLLEIARRHGTPAFAYDVDQLRARIGVLRAGLPASVQLIYSLKANPSLGLCGVIAAAGLGADVASAGEMVIARAAGFAPKDILVSGPDKSPPALAQLRDMPEALVSLDSLSELQTLAGEGQPFRTLLRLRPDFCSHAHCAAGPDSRFGLVFEDLGRCRAVVSSATNGMRVVGLHVFAGSQVLDSGAVIQHLRGALEQSLRAAEVLGVAPEVLNLGGGFGIPYGPEDELDMKPIANELQALAERAAPARLMLELGRYVVAQCGWYLTTVIARQKHQGREAIVVDGGSHQRGDLCGIGLRKKAMPVVLHGSSTPSVPTDVLTCLSLPGDLLAEAAPLPSLAPGDVLGFPNAGAYGLSASPHLFHGHPLPAEIAFDGTEMEVLRARQPLEHLLVGQRLLQRIK